MTKIFVYGTLKQGFGNHRLLEGAINHGPCRTPPAYTMYSLGGYPGILPNGSTVVHGELYEVTPSILDSLDRLEGHPSYYRREPVVLSDGSHVEAYLARFLEDRNNYRLPIIETGIWR